MLVRQFHLGDDEARVPPLGGIDLEHVRGVIDQVARLAHDAPAAMPEDHRLRAGEWNRIFEFVAAETAPR